MRSFAASVLAMLTLSACGGAEAVDPAIGAIGEWSCSTKTFVEGKTHRQLFTMTLGEDQSAVLVSERTHREPGASIKYLQTSVGTWKAGGMRFGFDNLTHSMSLVKAGGRLMRARSENQHESYARQLLREKLKPTRKVRFDVALMDGQRFRLTEGEGDEMVRTSCTRVKEPTPEELAAAEEDKAAEEEVPQNTRSALFN